MNKLSAYLSRVAIFQYLAHLAFWILSALCNRTGSNSLPLFWAFFFLQNLFSFLYICDNKRRHEVASALLPFTLLHFVCAPYGFFGAVLAMHVIPCPINGTGFAYKIAVWTATNFIFYSHFWNQLRNNFASFHPSVVLTTAALVFAVGLIAYLYELYLKRRLFRFIL